MNYRHPVGIYQTIEKFIGGMSIMKDQSPYEVENSHRPPYSTNYRSLQEPMTVLASLLSRADNTPLSQRRRDPNNLLDREGKVIDDPADTSQKLALTSDPNISFEKWAE